MIQILGLRDIRDSRTNKTRKTTAFFGQGYRLEHIEDVFNPDRLGEILAKIPEAERYNLYFTVAECFEEKERELREQWVIPFDIDGIDYPNESSIPAYSQAVAEAACKALGVPFGDVGAIFSGHGVQLFLKINYAIRDKNYFDQEREHYAGLCEKITRSIAAAGLSGRADPTVWSHARLMRLPDTENRKPDKPIRRAFVLNSRLAPQGFYLAEHSGVSRAKAGETVSDAVLKQYPKPDSEAVQAGCPFLVRCKDEPRTVSEPQWYAQVSITARLENGRELTHHLSEGHPGYNFDETELKIDQALAAAGPRTCKDISTRWSGCPSCPHYGKITSPIMIRGENYLGSKDFGFRKMVMSQDGTSQRPGPPNYVELIRYFGQQHPFITLDSNGAVFIHNGKHWEESKELRLKAWMRDIVRPEPNHTEMTEFVNQLRTVNVRATDWFVNSSQGLMNFSNCVLDLRTMATEPHKPDQGFLTVLPFNYDPMATAPRWRQFLLDSMKGDVELVKLLEEFGGYAISGDPYWSWAHKGLLVVGEGENGKSIYLDALCKVVGRRSYSSVFVQDFEKPTMRHGLFGKLFNKSEETGRNAFKDSQIFKAITSGNDITAKELYKNEFEFPNTAKIIMSANALPANHDNSHGMARRLIIVPFNERFSEDNPKRDPFLSEALAQELPGICNSILAAYREAKQRGGFTKSRVAANEHAKYILESDPIRLFLDDCCQISSGEGGESSNKNLIYQAYSDYSRTNGYHPVAANRFWRRLGDLIPDFEARDFRQGSGGARTRVLKGVKLINEEF